MSPSANDPNIEPYAEPQAPPPAAPAKPPEPDPQIAALQKEVDDLKGIVAESNRTAEFWAAKAREASAAPAQPAPQPEPEEDDTDVLEAITTEGTKGFDRLAQKRGFVRRDDVQRMIDERTASVTKEQELLGRYPDLKDRNSEFFKMTANNYGQLVKDGTPMRAAMEIAAEKTELEFMRSGKISPAGNKGDRESERLARIAAQGGGGGPRRPAGDEDDDNSLTAEQKHIAHMMGISEEAYLKRAKQGVRMGGKPANR